jgi:O-methyltransferase
MRPVHTHQTSDIHFSKIHWPGAQKQEVSKPMKVLNKVLNKMGSPLWLQPRFDYREEMVSLEQVVNFQHLLTRVLDNDVHGDVVELGCYTGNTSAVIGTILREAENDRAFHVYDSFEHNLSRENIDVLGRFVENMKVEDLELPYIHRGDLFETIPDELPERIAFAHIDLGVGGDTDEHKDCLWHCLHHVYQRMRHGSICMLMDYHVEGTTVQGADVNPGVREACDEFFADKPEKMVTLYGGPCSHGYFKKI